MDAVHLRRDALPGQHRQRRHLLPDLPAPAAALARRRRVARLHDPPRAGRRVHVPLPAGAPARLGRRVHRRGGLPDERADRLAGEPGARRQALRERAAAAGALLPVLRRDAGLVAELRRIRRHGGVLAPDPARPAHLLHADGGRLLLVLSRLPERRARRKHRVAQADGLLRRGPRAGLRARVGPAPAVLRVHQVLAARRRREQQHRVRLRHRLVHAARGGPRHALARLHGQPPRLLGPQPLQAPQRLHRGRHADAGHLRLQAGRPAEAGLVLRLPRRPTACCSRSAATRRSTGSRTPSCPASR